MSLGYRKLFKRLHACRPGGIGIGPTCAVKQTREKNTAWRWQPRNSFPEAVQSRSGDRCLGYRRRLRRPWQTLARSRGRAADVSGEPPPHRWRLVGRSSLNTSTTKRTTLRSGNINWYYIFLFRLSGIKIHTVQVIHRLCFPFYCYSQLFM